MDPGLLTPMASRPTWRLLWMDAQPSVFNMAADDSLLRAQATAPQPTLRLYQWATRALSFGYFQDIPTLVDVDACMGAGIELIRRPTGGGVVVHDGSLTFTIVVPAGSREIPAPEDAAYQRVGEIAVDAFRRLGVQTRTATEAPPDDDKLPNWCMLHAVRNDVLHGSRKVAGVSRRAIRQGALYQAYVFIDRPSSELLTVAPSTPIAQHVDRTAASLSEAAGRDLSWDEVADGIRTACAETLGVALEPAALTRDEEMRIEAAVEQAYGRSEWLTGNRARRRALRRSLDDDYLSK